MSSDAAFDALADEVRAQRLPAPEDRKLIRQRARVSLRRAAEALGVDTMTLWRWEQGMARPRPAHAAAYRQLLDVLEEASR